MRVLLPVIVKFPHLCEMTAALHNHDIKLHRIKCMALIRNIIALYTRKDLVDDISKVSYSVITDESRHQQYQIVYYDVSV